MRLRALLVSGFLALVVATPSFAQSPSPSLAPDSSWDEFQAEVQRFRDWGEVWIEEAGAATTKDEQTLFNADLLARSLEHTEALYRIDWEDCYRDYAQKYVDTHMWFTAYVAGIYMTTEGPDIEPLQQSTAQLFVAGFTVNTQHTAQALAAVDCPTD